MVCSTPGNEVSVISCSLEGTSTDMCRQSDTASMSDEEREVESMLAIEGDDEAMDTQMDTRADEALGAFGLVSSAILEQRKSRGGHRVAWLRLTSYVGRQRYVALAGTSWAPKGAPFPRQLVTVFDVREHFRNTASNTIYPGDAFRISRLHGPRVFTKGERCA